MKPGDNFMKRLRPLSELPRLFDIRNRFGEFNEKTLGFLLYAENERDVLRYSLDERICVSPQKKPDTALRRARDRQNKQKQNTQREHHRIVDAVDAFLKVIDRHNLDRDDVISKEELEAAFRDEENFSKEQAELLFGEGVTVEKAFEVLDKDKNKMIKYHELVHFIEECGISLQARFLGYERRHIDSLVSFINTLQSALVTNIKRVYVDDRDIARTVGINTGHLGTTDFNIEDADRDYVFEQGKLATIAFLKYYAEDKKLPKRPEKAASGEISNSATPSDVAVQLDEPRITNAENFELDETDADKQPFLVK